MNPLKVRQGSPRRRQFRIRNPDVNLRHLVAFKHRMVRNFHRELDLSRFDLLRLQIAVFKIAVAQAISERIQRLMLHVAVCPALHAVVCEIRQFLRCPVKRDRQSARRHRFSHQQPCRRQTAHLSGIPYMQNRTAVFISIAYRHGTACRQEQNHRSSRLTDRL